MKKLVTLALCALLLMAALTGCATQAKTNVTINVATLKGPTGIGMAGLFADTYKDSYNITIATAPDEVSAALISGEVDIAAVPANMAAALYNKTEGQVLFLGYNTLGVLYVLENGSTINSLADLAGKKLMATGQGSTPEYIINYLLEKNGIADSVTVEYTSEHSELATLLASGEETLGMLPEPNVTAAMAKNANLRIALDLTDEWSKVSDATLVQGCLVVRKEFYEAHQADVNIFLADYKKSVAAVTAFDESVLGLIESFGIMPSVELAKKAIPNCNITCVTGANARRDMETMLSVLFEANSKSVGGAMPGDDFYIG